MSSKFAMVQPIMEDTEYTPITQRRAKEPVTERKNLRYLRPNDIQLDLIPSQGSTSKRNISDMHCEGQSS